jgi:hypothetical protein
MDDARFVCGGEPVGHLDGEREGLVHRQPPLADPGVERAALDALHHDEVPFPAGVAAHVVDGDDVRVVERRRRARLAQEALEPVLAPSASVQPLIATLRSSCVSCARYTTPIPPSPSVSTSS